MILAIIRRCSTLLLIAIFSLVVIGNTAFAQVGPCPASGECADGQVCIGEGGDRQCYETCTPGTSGACSSGTCMPPEGRDDHVCCALSGCPLEARSATSSEPVADTDDEDQEFTSITPTLGVDIPGVEFTEATKQGDDVYVPFLAQYISGAYRYAVGIVLILAIVMVVYGGFRYLIGSSLGEISRGKEIIRDALAGMLIVLAAYLILQTVNPATIDLSVLKVGFVTPQEVILRNTRADTTGGEGVESGGAPPDAQYTSCPVNLTNPASTEPYRRRDDRVEEFMEKIETVVSGSSREKVISISQAAVECGLHMGACGSSSETVYEAAGIAGHGRIVKAVGTQNIHYLQDLTRNCRTNNDTRECKREARGLAAERFRSNTEGWPESFTDILEPGDFINVFTVWTSDNAPNGAGQHSAIFMGWVGGGRARLFNGSWSNNVRYSNYCITSECGENMYPITNIWKPE